MDKTEQYKFTLQFSKGIPEHDFARQMLSCMKRGKSDYVARTISFYEANKMNVSTPQIGTQEISNANLIAELLKVLTAQQTMQQAQIALGTAKFTKLQEEPVKKAEAVAVSDSSKVSNATVSPAKLDEDILSNLKMFDLL